MLPRQNPDLIAGLKMTSVADPAECNNIVTGVFGQHQHIPSILSLHNQHIARKWITHGI